MLGNIIFKIIALGLIASSIQSCDVSGNGKKDKQTVFDTASDASQIELKDIHNEKLVVKIADLNEKITLIEDTVNYLEEKRYDDAFEFQQKIDDLTARISELESDEGYFNLKSTEGFTRVKTSSGCFFVAVHEVQPYLDGFKVIFEIGNPYYATFSNPEITLKWNRSFRKHYEEYKKLCAIAQEALKKRKNVSEKIEWPKTWSESFQSKSYTIMKDLRPGIWNKVEVVISPATIDQIEEVRLSIKTKTVQFTTE